MGSWFVLIKAPPASPFEFAGVERRALPIGSPPAQRVMIGLAHPAARSCLSWGLERLPIGAGAGVGFA